MKTVTSVKRGGLGNKALNYTFITFSRETISSDTALRTQLNVSAWKKKCESPTELKEDIRPEEKAVCKCEKGQLPVISQ
ncbi:hypothetical protein CHS0354_027112 [Potamilus streckersoni]|uniref:Uncharacterized protein n=1 Tax=Potamilus streckersoni TaxID=2493646 RepID=A0AAE0S0D9_9BIVA|nr:hypothetical protein CHS0354_027112 [Potamilus streckersoni]